MESPKGVPSVNLDGDGSCRQEGTETGSNRPKKRDNKSEMETQTYGSGGGEGRNSEIEDSKTSFELMDMLKERECLSTSSSCFSRPAQRKPKKSKDRRLKRHHPDRTDNFESNAFETNESSPIPGSLRSSAREIILPPDTHAPKSDDHFGGKESQKNNEGGTNLDSAVRETLMAENKRLKEVLSRERRHHTKEKNRIRQVLFAIDDALSSLPTRLGKIRVQNQKNLIKMKALPIEFRDRGDFEVIVESCPKFRQTEELRLTKTASLQFSEDMYTDISNVPSTTLVKKMKSLNNLIEEIKTGQSAPIEAALNNELCAISLLKNEIKYTKKQIERKSKTDSESAIIANWQSSRRDVPNLADCSSRRTVDTEDIEKLEKYIWLQKEAISLLSLEVQKTKELVFKEMKEKEEIQNEKRALMTEITQLKNPVKARGETQRSKGRSGDTASSSRPFRIIKELKNELEEKEKTLTSLRSKVARLEAATSNKGILLEAEKRKVEELEAKVKIVTTENKSFSMQINSLQYINKELKDQMEILKNQIDILIKQNAELSASNPYDLKPHFTELAEMLKREDARVRIVQEEADKKVTELENQHLKEMNLVRTTFERSEKMNFEYMRTLKALLLCLHNHQLEKGMKMKKKNSYGRVKEILHITESELENLFSGNLKETSEKELEELYEQCYSFVAEDEDCEFSLKLSSWMFDVIKEKMTDQNSSDSV